MPSGSFRGGITHGLTMYGAWEGELYTVNQSGETTLYSTNLSGTDYPFFGRNSATTPGIVVVKDNSAFIVNTTASAVQNYPDADVGSPTCCCGYLGFVFFGYGDGTLQVTNYNTTEINTLNQARTASNPDGIKNIFGYNGQIYAMGANTVEIWGEPVNATGFPLTRVGFNILPGLLASHAVAGWEPEYGYQPMYVGSDSTVRQLNGYQAAKVSPTDLDREIAAIPIGSIESINALVYSTGGHAFWQLNLPSGKSWVYYVNEGSWHERKSQYRTNSKLARSIYFSERWCVGDVESSDLLAVDATAHTEGGAEITAVMESGPAKAFPNRMRIPRCDFDFTPGVGIATGTDPVQTDPSVLLEVSLDGGRTWPTSWVRKLGKQAKSNKRIYVLNAGVSNDEGARWRWSVSDPVHVGFAGANMDLQVGNK